ncbi:MAG: PA2779 family protein [Xanthomonadales bacterium]|nr:PA2779 family protein [Xanthomonadales bacterium]
MYRKTLSFLLSVALLWGGVVAQASAALIETGDALSIDARQDRIAEIQTQLARDDVQRALTDLGVDPLEAQSRVESLSDQELLLLEQELETLPAGGDGFFALLGVIFVVLLVLELVGVTNVFTKA